MNKSKFLSMLLAATLTLSSMSVTASVSAAAPSESEGASTNLLTAMTEASSGELTSPTVNEGNGYLHLYNRSNNGGVGYQYNGTLNKDVVYYISFDVRDSVSGTGASQQRLRTDMSLATLVEGSASESFPTPTSLLPNDAASGFKHFDNDISAEWKDFSGTPGFVLYFARDGWEHAEFAFKPVNDKTNPVFSLFRGTNASYNLPLDIDNFKLWYYEQGSDEPTYLVNWSFDGAAGKTAITTDPSNRVGHFYTTNTLGASLDYASIDVLTETAFDRISAVDDTATTLTYTSEDGIAMEAGVYSLGGRIRINYHVVDASEDNSAMLEVTAKIDGEDTVLYSGTVTSEWLDITSFAGTYLQAAELTELTVSISEAKSIDISELYFGLDNILTDPVTAVGEGNLLDGATVIYPTAPNKSDTLTDAKGNEVDTNGYITISGMPYGQNKFFTIDTGIVPTLGRTYYIGFDTRLATDTQNSSIRIVGNVKNQERIDSDAAKDPDAAEMNDNYVKLNANTEMALRQTSQAGWFLDDSLNSEWNYLEGEFTPVVVPNGTLKFTITRGPNQSYHKPIDIDNLEIWYMNGDSRVVVFSRNFERATDLSVFSTLNATVTQAYDTVNDAAFEAGTPFEVSYLLSEALAPGRYIFTAEVKADSFLEDGTSTIGASYDASMSYTLDSGRSRSFARSSFNTAWSTVSGLLSVPDDGKVTMITLSSAYSGAFSIRNAVLTAVDKDNEGIPDVGIIMVLLAKMSNGTRTRVVKTEFIENGDLEANVVIYDIGANSQTEEDAGWYARLNSAHETKLTLVTENGNSFIRVSDLNTAQRGVFFNTGVVLQPGTYTFSVDLRISEKAGDANFTAKPWRDIPGKMQSMRANLSNPESVNSPGYGSNNGVDKDTVYDVNGVTVGRCKDITDKWTTYTDKIVIEEPTLAIFKIGGGTGGDKDSHGFDIDNLSLIGEVTVTTGNVVEDDGAAEADAAE